MHQTRQETSIKLPIQRKGTKYVARALINPNNSVPVVIAVRDILALAKTAREVKEMIKQKLLKINGRIVEDYRESIMLFNVLEAGKMYRLSILPTKKYVFEENPNKDSRLCKVIGRKLVKNGQIQVNLHDGTNFISKDKNIKVGDSIYMDLSGKVKKHLALAKGETVFIFSGKYTGLSGKVKSIEGRKFDIQLKDGETVLDRDQVIVQWQLQY